MFEWWQTYDTWIAVTGALCAMACALPGSFLVLRRMSMMGDAISHAVLPGIVIAFLVTKSLDSLPMFVGAVAVGVATTLLTQTVRRFGGVDEGASMGVVFTSLFAVGLILIRIAADHVDLDPGCVLYGAIELAPLDVVTSTGGFDVPRAAAYNGAMLAVNALVVMLLWKELKICSFDPELSTTVGINATAMHYLLMCLVAATTVTAFHAVGSILVIAMLIVPPATAYLLTDRLGPMVILSVAIAGASAVIGHWSAVAIPAHYGQAETSTSGMMAVAAGAMFVVAMVAAPRQGLAARVVHRRLLSLRITCDDVLGALYRAGERRETLSLEALRRILFGGPLLRAAIWHLRLRGFVAGGADALSLTPRGEEAARHIVRSHRLWEGWMVDAMGLRADHVHGPAEALEHITTERMREELRRETNDPDADPHGHRIPRE